MNWVIELVNSGNYFTKQIVRWNNNTSFRKKTNNQWELQFKPINTIYGSFFSKDLCRSLSAHKFLFPIDLLETQFKIENENFHKCRNESQSCFLSVFFFFYYKFYNANIRKTIHSFWVCCESEWIAVSKSNESVFEEIWILFSLH